MSWPSLFRWFVYWAIGSLVCMVLIAIGLTLANVIDYAPYGLALRRAEKMTRADLEALAAACTRYEQRGDQRLFGKDIPAEFHALKPIQVSIYPSCSDINLFEKGDDRYVFLRVSTSPENQDIRIVSFDGQRQRSRTLWGRNSQLTRRLNPGGRIVTITQWGMVPREWIVQPTRLLVIDRADSVGGSDQIKAEVPVSAEQRAAIESAIRGLGTEVRGHAFDAGVSDGIALRVSFSPDGTPDQSTDIVLENTWRGEVEQLVQTTSKVTGQDHAIAFPEIVKSMGVRRGHLPNILPLAEYDRRRYGSRIAWWCWWPRLSCLSR